MTAISSVRTYVLDTSVLLSDPWAVSRFAEHEVVLPLIVISELEDKRHHHELGWFAREALRMLDDLRLEFGRLDRPVPIGTENGTLQVELNHTDPSVLPVGFRTDSNDSRILACALNLAAEGKDVVLVSKDIPLRVKAGAVGLPADEFRAHDVVPSGWTGMTEIDVSSEFIDQLFSEGVVDLDEARELPCHTGIRLLGGRSSALGRVTPDKRVQLVRGEREAFGLHGRSAEQRVALDLLLDESIGIVSLGGKAAPVSPRWRSRPDSRLCWSGAATARSSSSVRCTRWGVRNWATCRAARARRWARGRRPSSTPSTASPAPR